MKGTLAAITAISLLVTGCGGGDDAAADASADSPEEAALAFAKCMREQGIDFPDPKVDGDGRITQAVRADRRNDSEMREAMEECRKHMEDAGPRNLSEEDRAEMQENALRFARCMREQGVDFPDPQPNGGIMIGPGSGIEPESESFRKAQEACRDELPGLRGGAPETMEEAR